MIKSLQERNDKKNAQNSFISQLRLNAIIIVQKAKEPVMTMAFLESEADEWLHLISQSKSRSQKYQQNQNNG